MGVQDQPNELHREAHPEEEIEFDHTEEDLVMSVHCLDAAVRSKEFEHFPAEFRVNLPSESAIYELGDGYHYRNDDSEDLDGNMGESRSIWRQC